MRNRKAFSKEEKLIQIIAVFLEEFRKGNKELTVADVARGLNITPSTKLRKLMRCLNEQNVLSAYSEPHVGIAGFRVIWLLTPAYLEYAKATLSQQKKGRDLRINTPKGQFIEVFR